MAGRFTSTFEALGPVPRGQGAEQTKHKNINMEIPEHQSKAHSVCPSIRDHSVSREGKKHRLEGGTSQDRPSSDPAEGEQTRVQPFLSFSFVLIFKVNMTIMVSSWCPVRRCS